MAQLVARLVRNEKVGGSSPPSSTEVDGLRYAGRRLPPFKSLVLDRIAAVPAFRRGTLPVGYRTCGRPTCRCARPGEQGHGPRGLWTRTVKGAKSRGQYIPVEQVYQVRAELDDYAQFAGLVDDYVEINEVLCKAKIGPPPAAGRKRARRGATLTRALVLAAAGVADRGGGGVLAGPVGRLEQLADGAAGWPGLRRRRRPPPWPAMGAAAAGRRRASSQVDCRPARRAASLWRRRPRSGAGAQGGVDVGRARRVRAGNVPSATRRGLGGVRADRARLPGHRCRRR